MVNDLNHINKQYVINVTYFFFEIKDGVVLIDPEYVKDRKVYAHVLAAFRYGRDDLDVLGLTFRKDLFIAQQQVYPQLEPPKNLTHLQQRLLRKLGPNAYPFFFQIPKNAPASVTLQPAPGDTGKVVCDILILNCQIQ